MTHEMQIVGDHHHAVSGRNPSDGNETHQGGNADVGGGPPSQEEASNQGDRNVQQYLCDKHRHAKVGIKKHHHDQENQEAHEEDAATGFLLGLKLSLVTDEVSFGQGDLSGHACLQRFDERLEITLCGVDTDDKAALGVFSLDDIGPLGMLNARDGSQGYGIALFCLDVKSFQFLG